jgi:hypothetical protein
MSHLGTSGHQASNLHSIMKIAEAAVFRDREPRAESNREGLPECEADPRIQKVPLVIRRTADRAKLLRQLEVFDIPNWVALPTFAAHLQIVRGGSCLAPFDLRPHAFILIGKNAEVCNLVLDNPLNSAVHAAMMFHGERRCFVIEDRQSTNGVTVDGVRLRPRRPTALAVDSKIQFGGSCREYFLRFGVPKKNAARVKNATIAEETKAEPVDALSESHPLGPSSPPPFDPTAAHAAINAAPQPSPETLERHFRHILIKHKDVRKPISAAPRNKGEMITRSMEDALELAHHIRGLHEKWSEDQFVEAVRVNSECATARKDGDLGVVEKGEYEDMFDAAAFRLGPEEVSYPVQTSLGLHLIFRCRN